jgi:hypothetical protein
MHKATKAELTQLRSWRAKGTTAGTFAPGRYVLDKLTGKIAKIAFTLTRVEGERMGQACYLDEKGTEFRWRNQISCIKRYHAQGMKQNRTILDDLRISA